MGDAPLTTTRLLVVTHSRGGSTGRLRDAVVVGAAQVDGVEVESLDATDAGTDDVDAADALIVCTPARFGALAGLTKDFLERIYPWFEETPFRNPGLPYAVVAKGASDAQGAVRDIERIGAGLRWKPVVPPLVVEGDLTPHHLTLAEELGATVAAGTEAGLW